MHLFISNTLCTQLPCECKVNTCTHTHTESVKLFVCRRKEGVHQDSHLDHEREEVSVIDERVKLYKS